MTTPYRLSFTTGGLFVPEAPVVVACYFTHRDWQKTRDQVRQDKLLQVRTDAAATRISKELVARLELLTEADLLSAQHLIQPALPSPYLAQLLAQQGPEQLLIFPATDMDIQRWLT